MVKLSPKRSLESEPPPLRSSDSSPRFDGRARAPPLHLYQRSRRGDGDEEKKTQNLRPGNDEARINHSTGFLSFLHTSRCGFLSGGVLRRIRGIRNAAAKSRIYI